MKKFLNQSKFFRRLELEKITPEQYMIVYKLAVGEQPSKEDRKRVPVNTLSEWVSQSSSGKLLLSAEGRTLVDNIDKLFNDNLTKTISRPKGTRKLTKKEKEKEKKRNQLQQELQATSTYAHVGKYALDFGKHKGKQLADVPLDYLEWMAEQHWCPAKVKAFLQAREMVVRTENAKNS